MFISAAVNAVQTSVLVSVAIHHSGTFYSMCDFNVK